MVITGLKSFQMKNAKLPRNILFYRDGVGEGMYEQVFQEEVKQIHEAFAKVYEKQMQPKLVFLVVQKRNHFRSIVASNCTNPPVGTFISTGVVDLSKYKNFYLYSHQALKGTGTSRPTHYQILLNDMNLSVENLAHFTFASCHLHQACTRSVSIPPAVFCADKASFKAYQNSTTYTLTNDVAYTAFML